MAEPIHAIVLTLNEGRHLRRCIESLRGQCDSVTVVDSGSTDDTVEVARAMGATVLSRRWVNYATQMNFAADTLAGADGWLLRIDADEVVDRDSVETLRGAVGTATADVDGILVQRRIHFLGRRIRYGGIEPSWQLRLWRNGRGRCEQRWMDEHVKVMGRVKKSGIVLSDINLNSVSWWTAKHNGYASREAIDILNQRHGFAPKDAFGNAGASPQARVKRLVKERLYLRLPDGLRSFLYLVYRYVIRLGFLDGVQGYYFTMLQGFWYRTLVDAKVREIMAYAEANGCSIVEAIRERTGIDPVPAEMVEPVRRMTAAE